MLVSGARTGASLTRAAAVEFSATLTWRCLEEMPSNAILATLSGSESVSISVSETEDEDQATHHLSGEILALDEPELSGVIDDLLRAVSKISALTGAILETRVVRHAEEPEAQR